MNADTDCSIGVCDTCKRGYYGPDCRERCPAECDNYTCDKWTGHCFRCGLGRQGDYCSQGKIWKLIQSPLVLSSLLGKTWSGQVDYLSLSNCRTSAKWQANK